MDMKFAPSLRGIGTADGLSRKRVGMGSEFVTSPRTFMDGVPAISLTTAYYKKKFTPKAKLAA
jgi:hypothetical protein